MSRKGMHWYTYLAITVVTDTSSICASFIYRCRLDTPDLPLFFVVFPFLLHPCLMNSASSC